MSVSTAILGNFISYISESWFKMKPNGAIEVNAVNRRLPASSQGEGHTENRYF
jgi:hypothetical protein